jgi:hypothetical protein
LVIKALDPDWIRIRIDIQPKMLDPDLDPDEMNADPQPCFFFCYLQALGMKLVVRTNNMGRMKAVFTAEIFTESTVAAHAVKEYYQQQQQQQQLFFLFFRFVLFLFSLDPP